jgi:hypothetical protein
VIFFFVTVFENGPSIFVFAYFCTSLKWVCLHLIISRLCVAAEAILLGFQHYLVMLGTTVLIPSALVPQMGGGNVRPGGKIIMQIFRVYL